MIRVLLVDDFPIVRQGLTQLIDHETDMTVCGEAGDVSEALTQIEALRPDIAIVDLSLPGTQSGFDLAKTIVHEAPATQVLVLSMHDEALHAERALRAGARGYIMKSEPPEQILSAIRQINQGDIYLSEEFSSQMLNTMMGPDISPPPSAEDSLSDRERDVFDLIGGGMTAGEIAIQLGVSSKTVESHKSRIRHKIGVKSAAHLQQRANQWLARDRPCAPPDLATAAL
jgi:DNA-binding NarL/FixJ family response regulator